MRSIPGMLILLLSCFVTIACFQSAQSANKKQKEQYRHVVMFQFKEDVTDQQITEVEKAFLGLEKQIDTVVDIEFGTNVSPENLNDGLTHCFLVTFRNKAGLEVYLPHAAHQEFVELVGPRLEKVMVIDYVSQ